MQCTSWLKSHLLRKSVIIVGFHITSLFRHKAPPQQDTTILSKSVEAVKTFQIDLSRNNSRDSSDTGSDVTVHGVTLNNEKSHDTSHDPEKSHNTSHDPEKSHDTSHDPEKSHDTSHDPEQTPTIDDKGTGDVANGEIAQPPALTITASVSSFK